MGDRKYFVLGFSALFVVITAAFLSVNVFLSPSVQLSECKTLEYNSKSGIDLVFLSSRENAQKYADALFEATPLKENRNNFNVFYIDDYKAECQTYKGVAILCYSKELLNVASSCPNDYIIVLNEKSPSMRSSSYMNVMSINTNHPLSVMVHEFGHSFANLAEEYAPAKIPRGSRNCQMSCEEFEGFEGGCYNECSDGKHSRSIENGVMRTLASSEYGEFNEGLILNRIPEKNGGITGNVVNEELSCAESKHILVKGFISGGSIEILEKSIEQGCAGNGGSGSYRYELSDKNGNILTSEFNPELVFTDAPALEVIEGETFEYEGEFFLSINYAENAKELKIYDYTDNELIEEVNLDDIDSRPCRI